MKFSLNCRAKELRVLFTILGNFFAHFRIGQGDDIQPQKGLGKSLPNTEYSPR